MLASGSKLTASPLRLVRIPEPTTTSPKTQFFGSEKANLGRKAQSNHLQVLISSLALTMCALPIVLALAFLSPLIQMCYFPLS